MLDGKSILVVDDEPDLREILCDEFSLIGAQVSDASNGKEALRKVEQGHFDVVVTDLRMPGGDGISLARTLKAQPTSPVVVLMTGFADLTAEEAFEIGAEGFLTKPFHLESIRENLNRLLTPPETRWSENPPTATGSLQTNPEVFQGQDVALYLGRGGFFFPGERLAVRMGQEVSFKVGNQLEGVGLVRWVRMGPAGHRRAGAGIEFLSLTPESQRWVSQEIARIKPQAYLPRGF